MSTLYDVKRDLITETRSRSRPQCWLRSRPAARKIRRSHRIVTGEKAATHFLARIVSITLAGRRRIYGVEGCG